MRSKEQKYKLTVDVGNIGKRLDIFLANKLNLTRSAGKKLLKQEKVLLNSELIIDPQFRIREDDLFSVLIPNKPDNNELEAAKQTFTIAWEDEQVLVINKPSGLVVHPGAGHSQDTLANGIKYYLELKGETPLNDGRSGLVHRLDGPTSGLIIFAKNTQALDYISSQFSNRQITKIYIALVNKAFPSELVVNTEIGRDKFNRQKFSSRTDKKRISLTKFKNIFTTGEYSLIAAYPHTGRTHQIRVHLAESGFPIVGDNLYGGEKNSRLMLHAYYLEFFETKDSKLRLKADLPTDFYTSLISKDFNLDLLTNALKNIIT